MTAELTFHLQDDKDKAMKRIGSYVRAVSMAGVIAMLPATLVAQGTGGCNKIAYVVGRAILEQTPGYVDANASLQKEVDGFRAQVEKLNARLDSSAAALEQKSVVLSATTKQAETKKLQALKDSIDIKTNELQQKAAQRRDDLLKPFEDRVQAVLDGLRAAGNYCYIFDVSATGNAILSADKSLDLTQKAIDQLKASKPGN
jgi:Skp family chaperone for outer membrane proteins